MNHYFFVVFLFFIISLSNLKSDTIYWAEKIVGFSTQTGNREFSAEQILGKPGIIPEHGKTAVAWMPKFPTDRIEWIRVKFAERIYTKQIIINENLNPGAIVKIILYDSLNQGRLVYSNNRVTNKSHSGKLLKINLDNIDFRSNELKIEVNIINYLEEYQLDAVGIADYTSDYDVKINSHTDPVVYEKESLGPNINSKYKELAPIISQDGKTLVFTREGHPDNIGNLKKQDVWMAKVDSSGKFGPAFNLGPPINNENTNFAISVSTNANSIFLGTVYYPDGRSQSGFSTSYFNGTSWSFPDSIRIKNFYNLLSSGSFCLANNGKILITSVKREDSFGKTDMYVSFLGDDGIWTEPVNLGSTLNTAEEELSPFLAGDNKTLYFSTSGFPGYGNNDMFVSRRLDDSWTNWSEPVNLGENINTPGWDAYYTITADGQYAYFVSSNNYENEDIFRIKLPELLKPDIVVIVKGKVLNQKTNLPVEANISYEILPEGKEVGVAISNAVTGEYSIVLPAGSQYGFLANAKGFVSINENLDLKVTNGYSEISRDLYLVPFETGQTVRINNIFFNYGEYVLLPESFAELNRITKLLADNPKMIIQINGHTDNVGNDNFNKTLSLDRAQAVADYLISKKINPDRLKIRGFGRNKPVAKNDTEEGKSKNRRVEFIILEK